VRFDGSRTFRDGALKGAPFSCVGSARLGKVGRHKIADEIYDDKKG